MIILPLKKLLITLNAVIVISLFIKYSHQLFVSKDSPVNVTKTIQEHNTSIYNTIGKNNLNKESNSIKAIDLNSDVIRATTNSLLSYENLNMGITLSHEENLSIEESSGEGCTYPTESTYCITASYRDSPIELYILVVDNSENLVTESGVIHLSQDEIQNATIIESNEFAFIRPEYFNAPTYGNRYSMIFQNFDPEDTIENISEFGNIILNGGIWVLIDTRAYYITYVTYSPSVPEIGKTINEREIHRLDELLSTLQIDPEVDLF